MTRRKSRLEPNGGPPAKQAGACEPQDHGSLEPGALEYCASLECQTPCGTALEPPLRLPRRRESVEEAPGTFYGTPTELLRISYGTLLDLVASSALVTPSLHAHGRTGYAFNSASACLRAASLWPPNIRASSVTRSFGSNKVISDTVRPPFTCLVAT